MYAIPLIFTFVPLGHPGPISVPGVKVGDYAFAYFNQDRLSGGFGNEIFGGASGTTASFEGIISVADQIQQFDDRAVNSGGTYAVLIFRNSGF